MDVGKLRQAPDFSTCVQECLRQVDAVVSPAKASPSKGAHAFHSASFQATVDEYIFGLHGRQPTQTSVFNEVQQLEVLTLFCSYFEQKSDADQRQRLFDAIFNRDGPSGDVRVGVLVNSIPLAVHLRSISLLAEAGNWLIRTNRSDIARTITERIEQEFICDMADSTACSSQSAQLPLLLSFAQACPSFAATLFGIIVDRCALDPPTFASGLNVHHLRIFTDWFTLNSRFAFRAVRDAFKEKHQQQSFAKLIAANVGKLVLIVCFSPFASSTDDEQLFGQLHTALLQALLIAQKSLPADLAGVLRTRDICDLLEKVSGWYDGENDPHAEARLSQSLDRLAQAVQIASASGCFHGKKRDIEKSLRFRHALLEMVLKGD